MTKKDILELKRRLKKDGCTFTKMRGCYVDSQKNILLDINETFLNLEEEEFYKYLEIAKKTLSGTLGNNLLELSFLPGEEGEETQRFLLGLRDSGLKADGLTELFYERVIREYDHAGNYLILLFHDAYDVITKTTDHAKLDESEEVFEYILCAICPVELSKAGLGYRKDENRIGPRIRDWVVSPPEAGFLFPSFSDRSADIHSVTYYTKDPKEPDAAFMEQALGCAPRKTAAEEKKAFHAIVKNALPPETEDAEELLLDIQQELSDLVDEHKTIFEEEPARLTSPALRDILTEKGLSEETVAKVEACCQEEFGDAPPPMEALIDAKALAARAQAKKQEIMQQELLSLKKQLEEQPPAELSPEAHGEIILRVDDKKAEEIKVELIHGKRCILIPLEEEERATVNGSELPLI